MSKNKVGIDTNILVYALREDRPLMMHKARSIIHEHPVVSSQVVSEYLNAIQNRHKRKRRGLPHDEPQKVGVIEKCEPYLLGCPIHPVSIETLRLAKELIWRHQFQMFDAIIVASCLEAGCEVLYSEDMHHSLFVKKQLRILNPFRRNGALKTKQNK
jgi:predicted nucleic acid-binding protein